MTCRTWRITANARRHYVWGDILEPGLFVLLLLVYQDGADRNQVKAPFF